MGWFTVDYEVLMDKDDFSIVNVKIENVWRKKHYLEQVKTFMDGLKETFKTNDLQHQFKSDFPREKCYVNNVLIKNESDFLQEIDIRNDGNGNNTIKKTIILLCTQASAFPITAKLFEKFSDYENDIHVSDFSEDNPLIFRFKIFDNEHLSVDIEKKFKIITIKEGEPVPLKTIKVNTLLKMKVGSDNVKTGNDNENNEVYYSISTI